MKQKTFHRLGLFIGRARDPGNIINPPVAVLWIEFGRYSNQSFALYQCTCGKWGLFLQNMGFKQYPTKQFNYSKSESYGRGTLKQQYSRCWHDTEPLAAKYFHYTEVFVLSPGFTSAQIKIT